MGNIGLRPRSNCDLYLSGAEAQLLRYAFITWGWLEFWPLLDKFVFKRLTKSWRRGLAAAREARAPEVRPQNVPEDPFAGEES